MWFTLLTLLSTAWADGYSADVELLRPTLGDESLPGVSSPRPGSPHDLRLGVLAQHQRDPLVLYEFGNEVGPIIGQREALALGAQWTPLQGFSVSAFLPAFSQRDGQVPDLRADGAGVGDLGVSALATALAGERGALGFRGDIRLPTGTADAYMGEPDVRTGASALGQVDAGPVSLLVDLGATLRTGLQTQEDWSLGSEWAVSGGLRWRALPDRLAVYGLTLARAPLSSPFHGGAENPVESVLGLRGQVRPGLHVDLGVGRGWTGGYGTTQQRVLLGIDWLLPQAAPKPAPPVVQITQVEPPPPDEPEPEVYVPDQEWGEHELARVVQRRIEIRDPIQFEFATAHILPVSLPTLHYVAMLLAENDRIAHLVIEGHASDEGSYAYNYDLSIRRARSVWEQLVRAGVHPDRISYLGMGEVIPTSAGEDEASLARNRRVEFHIVHQLDPLEPTPRYPTIDRLPWDGQPPASEQEQP